MGMHRLQRGPRLTLAAVVLAAVSSTLEAVVLRKPIDTLQWLSLQGLQLERDAGQLTAIVTHAGQYRQEYIDSAIMLGLSLKRHLPGYPMIALAIEGMDDENQALLRKAGWQILFVEDWDKAHCGKNCDQDFLGRWEDSFEKINAFRLPFQRVLFMDADTYVFDKRFEYLPNSTRLPDGYIAMAPDGCKSEYNSRVMLFKPDLQIFKNMMWVIGNSTREERLDQTVINKVYKNRIVRVDREFNCIDLWGVPYGYSEPCEKTCSEVFVGHFTGAPKPTRANRRFLEMVRRPGAPPQECTNTNWGACSKWSQYYCELRDNQKNLTVPLQKRLNRTGGCCHVPFDPTKDAETCRECPNSLEVSGAEKYAQHVMGLYRQSTIKPTKFNGGRPIYVKEGPTPYYLYYLKNNHLWVIGPHHDDASIVMYAQRDASCPRDAWDWAVIHQPKGWTPTKDLGFNVSIVESVEAKDYPSMLYNVKKQAWVHQAAQVATQPDARARQFEKD